MPIIPLPAHYDGEHIRLDEDYELTPDTRLIVTVLPRTSSFAEDESWYSLSCQNLDRAYGEYEPDYSTNLIKESNPDYEGS